MRSRSSWGGIRWIRLWLLPCRAGSRAFRALLVALAAALGAPKPKLLRQEDPVVQVDERDAREQ